MSTITTFDQLGLDEHFISHEPCAEGKLRKVCGNMAENENGTYLFFFEQDEVERIVLH